MYSETQQAEVTDTVKRLLSLYGATADEKLSAQIAAYVLEQDGLFNETTGKLKNAVAHYTAEAALTAGVLSFPEASSPRDDDARAPAAPLPNAPDVAKPEELAKAIAAALKPEAPAPVTELQQLLAWLDAKYPGHRIDWAACNHREQAHYVSEWKREKATAAEKAKPEFRCPPMPGSVATQSAARQNQWANLHAMMAAGYATPADFEKAGLPMNATHESKQNAGGGFR